MVLKEGFVQVITGDGKGKTTSAIGLALRALGAGEKVFFAQFLKSRATSEFNALSRFGDLITFAHYGKTGSKFMFDREPTEDDKILARRGLNEVGEAMLSGEYDLVILDEVNIATFFEIISVDSLLELIQQKPESVELILTGRRAAPQVIEEADLVTEMEEVKHYYTRGVKARKGIEY
jgi:cob(I)alamin adenosyltransferase